MPDVGRLTVDSAPPSESERMGRPLQEPLLGWRLWRLRPEGLRSWAARSCWRPGPNHATCLSNSPCPRSPGSGCRCGYWALFSVTRCVEHARIDPHEQLTVFGLIQGWGEVALHGEEGFRAADAAVVALFTDWVWGAGSKPGDARGWWWRLLHPGEALWSRSRTPPDPSREHLLTEVARTYAVPLLPLADALGSGFLAELGVDVGRREEVRRLLRRFAPAGDGPGHQGTGHHEAADVA